MNRALASVGALLLLLLPLASRAQDRSGELRLSVTDSSGAALPAHGTLISQASHFQLTFDTSPTGESAIKKLPLGSFLIADSPVGLVSKVN